MSLPGPCLRRRQGRRTPDARHSCARFFCFSAGAGNPALSPLVT